MKLRELLDGVSERPVAVSGDPDREITALVADSRRAVPGALFFALPGTRTDGRKHVAEAIANGAVAVAASGPVEMPASVAFAELRTIHRSMSEMAAIFFARPARRLGLVGITGTNGKTTVTWLLESIWRQSGRRPGIIGTIEYRVGDRAWPAPFTTPQPIELQALLAEMAAQGADVVAMEVSSHALALDRVNDCDWDAAVFTNLSRDHLDFHHDMESYFAAKLRLFTELLPRSTKPNRFAVVHRDDPWGRRLLDSVKGPVLTFGRSSECDVVAVETKRSLSGWTGEIRFRERRIRFRSSLVGEAHLENILAAAAVACGQELPDEAIAEGIAACRGVPGRMERVDEGAAFAVFVDYAHTPDALERSVKTLRSMTVGRVIVVFGCGGDRDRGKRAVMGEIAGRLADALVLTSDNPRSEDPYKILHEIEAGVIEAGLDRIDEAALAGEGATGYVIVEDRRRAIRLAVTSARVGDAVLIAGKGHEPYQIVGAERRPFDDRREARESLGGPAA